MKYDIVTDGEFFALRRKSGRFSKEEYARVWKEPEFNGKVIWLPKSSPNFGECWMKDRKQLELLYRRYTL